MDLSVVIPVRNQPGCIEKTLSSLAEQSVAADSFEVVVVDDGSTDGTAAVIKPFADRLNLQIISHGVNKGRSAARNRGAAAASGNQILFLDADSRARTDLVVGHVRWQQERPGDVILGRRVETGWWSMNELSSGRIPQGHFAFEEDQRDSFGLADPDLDVIARTPWLFAYTHNMSMPTDLFLSLGGFDEAFVRWGYEDTEFAYRIFQHFDRRSGHFHYDPDLVCYHMPHFRDWYGEWENTKAVLPYIKNKHRHFDVELLIHPPHPRRVAQTLPYYERCLEHLTSASAVAGLDRIAAAVPAATPELWIGFGVAALPGAGRAAATFDHARPASAENHHLLGIHTAFEADAFAQVVNVDLWRMLSPIDLSSAIMEGLRVAETVFLVMSKDVIDDPRNRLGLISDLDYVTGLLAGRLPTEVSYQDDHIAVLRCRRVEQRDNGYLGGRVGSEDTTTSHAISVLSSARD